MTDSQAAHPHQPGDDHLSSLLSSELRAASTPLRPIDVRARVRNAVLDEALHDERAAFEDELGALISASCQPPANGKIRLSSACVKADHPRVSAPRADAVAISGPAQHHRQ